MIIDKLRKSTLVKVQKTMFRVYNGLNRLKDNTQGMGTIEVVLIVAVLVALALLFKSIITEYASGIFDGIKKSTENAF